MRVLWVKAGKILPVDTGGKIRSYNLIKHLATRHQLVLLSYYGGERDTAYESHLRREFPGAMPIHDATPRHGVSLYLDYARRLLSPAPYAVNKYTVSAVRRAVGEWLRDGRFDVAVCDFLSASRNFPAQLSTPCVLFQHNVESVLWKRQARHEANPLRRLMFTVEALKMSRYERATVGRFPRVIAVSARDRDAMAHMTEPSRIEVVPTGVDVAGYRAAAGATAERATVMFLGSMDWEANIDAVDYFCREIWPAVRRSVPDALFRIVGRAPEARVRRLASESVEITGRVASVIDYLKDTAVFVVPLRIGGGTRLKIFEAMAAGRAVVSTSIGAEGLEVRDGHDVVLADTPETFANAVIALLKNNEERRRLGRAAEETAARHDWSAIALRFDEVLRHTVTDDGNRAVEPHAARVGA